MSFSKFMNIHNSLPDLRGMFRDCYSIENGPVCDDNIIDMYYTYYYCNLMKGNPVCGPNVVNMSHTYYCCSNLTGDPVCGPNVTNMSHTYYYCGKLTGAPVCGPNVTNMAWTYADSRNISGEPVCGPKVKDMSRTYHYGAGIIGNAACGNNVVNMASTYYFCQNLTGSAACGDNVMCMTSTYYFCKNLAGPPVCGNNVVNMYEAYCFCNKLTGPPACGPNVKDFSVAYRSCWNMTGAPVCGDNVINMAGTYWDCNRLTGSPVCGPNVTDMDSTYANCRYISGEPACGPNVTNMVSTYSRCAKLTGSAICEENVINIHGAYYNCFNIAPNAYFYSNNIQDCGSCFGNYMSSRTLNIYVPQNSTTLYTCLQTGSYHSLVGRPITWSEDIMNQCYYNTQYNLYIYPVANVREVHNEHLNVKQTFGITFYLVGGVASDERTTITEGDSYSTEISITESTLVFISASVTMGGIDISDSCLTMTDTKVTIRIPSVNGNIIIQARSAQSGYPCTSLTCNSTMSLKAGQDANLNVNIQPSNCSDSLYWDVSDPSALSVYQSSGEYWVHAVKSGTYDITFYCGNYNCKCRVTITEQVFQMTYNLGSNVTLSYFPREAVAGTAFATKVYNATDVTVIMGGVNITYDCLTYNYSDGYIYISISAITGDVVITAY